MMTEAPSSTAALLRQIPPLAAGEVSAPITPPRINPHSTPTSIQSSSVRMKIDCTLDYELDTHCDFIFLIHVANEMNGTNHGINQTVIEEKLVIAPARASTQHRAYTDPQSGNRFLRVEAAAGPLSITYRAVVDRLTEQINPHAREVPIRELPDQVLHYLMPTRYCESDLLAPAAQKLFGTLPPGYARVQAISDWVHRNIEYRIGVSDATTTARDVFVQRSGVCRDFAHLAVTFCRALNIPARLVCGYTRFPDPPPDFHAIFEAWLEDRWVLFDPTDMVSAQHVVRVATGRDAKDVAFATIFGPARMKAMSPEVEWVNESRQRA